MRSEEKINADLEVFSMFYAVDRELAKIKNNECQTLF